MDRVPIAHLPTEGREGDEGEDAAVRNEFVWTKEKRSNMSTHKDAGSSPDHSLEWTAEECAIYEERAIAGDLTDATDPFLVRPTTRTR